MHRHGLKTTENHDQSDYDSLKDEITEENISGFYQLLGKTESKKAVKVLGYENRDDYLVKHGYTTWFGQPSFEEWEKSWIPETKDSTASK